MLISSGLAMLILFGLLFYGFWKYGSDSVDVDIPHREIIEDIPPEPYPEPKMSDVMAQQAAYVEQNMTLDAPHLVQPVPPQPQIAPPPAQMQDAQANQTPPPVYQPSDPLTERAAILDVENPIVQPVNEPQAVDIPEWTSTAVSTADEESDYGVRYAANSPGRMLRPKRYRRNAAPD